MRSQKYILLLKWLKHRESARTCAASTVTDEVFACAEETSTAEVKKTRCKRGGGGRPRKVAEGYVPADEPYSVQVVSAQY